MLGNSDLTTTIHGWCNPCLYDHLHRMSVRLGSDTACSKGGLSFLVVVPSVVYSLFAPGCLIDTQSSYNL